MTTLTAHGRGAIGVVAVWGPGAVDVVDAAFRPARGGPLAATPPGRPRLGRIGRGLGDEVVAVVLEADRPSVEVQCHGGPTAIALVVEALQRAGAEPAEPARWAEHRAGSPIQAEALVDLARAETVRAATILLDQSQGALDRALDELAAALGHEPATAVLERLERLIARGRVGTRLTAGWRVVIRGRPNVGKSRLLNALAGYQRAIVDPTPGTTRDVVTVAAAFDGWPVQLIDTAGVRETEDELERAGIERAEHHAASADVVLQVLDRSEPLADEDRVLLLTPSVVPTIPVANKSDLPPAWGEGELSAAGRVAVTVSAERGDGLDELMDAVVATLIPDPPPAGAGVPFRPRHVERLREAADGLRRGAGKELVGRLLEDLGVR